MHSFLPVKGGGTVSRLSDGDFAVPLSALGAFAAQLEDLLIEQKVGGTDVIACACAQSVPHALTLLSLLQLGRSVALLPQGVDETDRLRRLCAFEVSPEVDGAGSDLREMQFRIRRIERRGEAVIDDPEPAVYLRTSGTTARSKIVMFRHAHLHGNMAAAAQRLELTDQDRVSIPVPIHHMYGFGAGLLPSIAAGASVDLQSNVNGLRVLERERIFRPDVVFLTPTFARTVAMVRRKPYPYRFTVLAGSRVPAATFSTYSELCGRIVQIYGSTEMGVMCAHGAHDSEEMRMTTVGRPMPGVTFQIDGATGQLLCNHEHSFEAYIDEAGRKTARNEWFPTGDVGRVDKNGYVSITGRRDNRIKRDGVWVSLADVEEVLSSLRCVKEAAVVSRGERERGEEIVAYVVLVGGGGATGESIRGECFQRLEMREVPDSIVLIESMPMLMSGKIDRDELKKRDAASDNL